MSPGALIASHLTPDGSVFIGQVIVRREGQQWEVRHREDADVPASGLASHTDPLEARNVGRYNQEGDYRALKGSPDLARGWRLFLPDLESAAEAVEIFYPAALALWAAHLETPARVRVIPMEATLGRQTGMYRFARNISAAGAENLIQGRCRKGCLRLPLWAGPQPGETPVSTPGTIPLICPEACNVFVADARKVAKAESETNRDADA